MFRHGKTFTFKTLLSLCFILSLQGRSYSQIQLSGNWLYEKCIDENNVESQWICSTYIQGFYHGLLFSERFHENKPIICQPATAMLHQLVDTVTKWLKDNPEKRSMTAPEVVFFSLYSAFPCKN